MNSTARNCAVAKCVKSAFKATRAPAPARASISPLSADVTVELRWNAPAALATKDAAEAAFPAESREDQALCREHDIFGPGRLLPEVIQQVVRAHFGDFRACYEAGLARNRDLTGRVDIAFVIGRDGSVSNAVLNGNTLPDCSVGRCIAKAFEKLSFPPPRGDVVSVSYPIMLTPSNDSLDAAPR